MDTTTTAVFLAALVTALATGLGALPFAFARGIGPRWLGAANSVAAGLMLAASFTLVFEGYAFGDYQTIGGVVLGLVFIMVAARITHARQEHQSGHHHHEHADPATELLTSDGRSTMVKAVLIMAIMTLHSAAEGIGVGVSFAGGEQLGLFITISIAVHNIPEGLAISLVLIPRGFSVARAAGWSVFSSLPQPLLAVPAFMFVTAFEPVLPYGLGMAAGAMIWMVFSELLPDALESQPGSRVATITTASIAVMLAFQASIG